MSQSLQLSLAMQDIAEAVNELLKAAAGEEIAWVLVCNADNVAQYVATLIKLFQAKTEKGELDEKLMERIERLLDLKGQ